MNRKGTAKLNTIKSIELSKQKEWDDKKLFEATPDYESTEKNKHFVTFPYPYMNGSLHLGHAFSLSKCEFSMGFERLMGKNTLWGFGLHCTGMPIKSSADKLKREMETFGYPPVFPEPSEEIEEKIEVKTDIIMDKSKAKKSKVVAKSGGFKYQWQIMRNNGMTDEEIAKFTTTDYWIEYYPPLTIEHMKRMGIKVDWRRSFITTDINPFYDSFVRWQFLKLKKSNKVAFGKRQSIFSPVDNQPCMDHDRSSGEGVGPQPYTLVKMELMQPYPACLRGFGGDFKEGKEGEKIYLVAATLRPETMYGQTNCWIHPDIEYVAVRTLNNGVIVCVERAARNMAYQEILSTTPGVIPIVARFKGVELIGCGLRAPLTQYDRIYTLPMMTIKQNKGTGIVTSVPSDSPDDFAALRDLQKKPAFREKYNISEDKVMPFVPVPIIEIPEFGNLCAVRCVEEMKIQSQNDADKLLEAKEKCYKLGFYNGVMLVGGHKGVPVQKAKELIEAELVASGHAIRYAEPERAVISRSGDECVVALCDQWFLNYKDAEWKKETKRCLEGLNTFGEEVRRNMDVSLANLHEYACSRSYGLGTRLPWDEQYLVESLSDSTIYMAYYTVAHALQGGTLRGSDNNTAGISAADMTPSAWEYVLGDDAAGEELGNELVNKLSPLRDEFRYWYPVDLRVSGKDLLPNHLTYYLYNHCAAWPNRPNDRWPQAIRANGHLLLNNEKMSKSTGNFLSVEAAIDKYSADGMRLAIADAGDSIEDANFVEDVADAGLLRLHTFLEWARETVSNIGTLRRGDKTRHCDRIFANGMARIAKQAQQHYKDMMYKRVVQVAFHELQSIRDRYREMCGISGFHGDLIEQFIETQCLLLSPICPHVMDHIWTDILANQKSILESHWPMLGEEDELLSIEEAYLDGVAHEWRKLSLQKPRFKNKSEQQPEPHNAAIVWIAKQYPRWQEMVLDSMVELAEDNTLPDNKLLNRKLGEIPEVKKRMKKAMDLIQMIRVKTDDRADNVARLKTPTIDERAVIECNIAYLERTLSLPVGNLEIRFSDECADEKLFDSCCPMEPKITFIVKAITNTSEQAARTIVVANPDLFIGMISHQVQIHDGDSVTSVVRKIAHDSLIEDFSKIDLYHYDDVKQGLTTIPNSANKFANLVKIDRSARFTFNAGSGVQLTTGDAVVDIGEKIKYVVN